MDNRFPIDVLDALDPAPVRWNAKQLCLDLHAMRTTLGTNLARAGVAPQIAQRIMRHADYRTTLKHYTVLGLTDTSKAISQLPSIQGPQRTLATGTDDAQIDRQPQYQQRQCERVRAMATQCDEDAPDGDSPGGPESPQVATPCEPAQRGATICEHVAGVAQLVERQLPKLNVEGSSPFTRFRHN